MRQSTIVFVIITLLLVAVEIYSFFGIRSVSAGWSVGLRRAVYTYWGLGMATSLIAYLYWMIVGVNSVGTNLMLFGSLIIINILSKTLFCGVLLIDDIVRAIRWMVLYFSPENDATEGGISRLNFLVTTGLGISAIPFTTMHFGILKGGHKYTVHEHDVYYPNLPEAFDGLKVVQLSDIHSGSFWNKSAVERGIRMVMDLKPDVILFTGDIVNNEGAELEDYKDVFGKLSAPMGVYSILGNHDYGDYKWGHEPHPEKEKSLQLLKDLQKEMGWDLLLNENRILEKDGEQIALLGVENWGLGFVQYGDLDKAYEGTEDIPFKLLMSHDPSHWDEKVKGKQKDIDLTLSGHTHGMQFGVEVGDFKWSPAKFKYENWAGWANHGNQRLYVNRGFGYIGYAGRFGIWPEITLLNMKRGEQQA